MALTKEGFVKPFDQDQSLVNEFEFRKAIFKGKWASFCLFRELDC